MSRNPAILVAGLLATFFIGVSTPLARAPIDPGGTSWVVVLKEKAKIKGLGSDRGTAVITVDVASDGMWSSVEVDDEGNTYHLSGSWWPINNTKFRFEFDSSTVATLESAYGDWASSEAGLDITVTITSIVATAKFNRKLTKVTFKEKLIAAASASGFRPRAAKVKIKGRGTPDF